MNTRMRGEQSEVMCRGDLQRGFTLMELLITMFIISLLMVIALPAYQHYMVRSKISEAIGLVGPVQNGVVESYLSSGDYPGDNTSAGLSDPSAYKGSYVRSIEVSAPGTNNGDITITLSTTAVPEIQGDNTIIFTPTNTRGQFTWNCTGGTVPQVYRPSQCRSD